MFGLIRVGYFINLKTATTVKHRKERDSFVVQGRTPDKLFAPQRSLLRQVTVVILFNRLIVVGYFIVNLKGVTMVLKSMIVSLCRVGHLTNCSHLNVRCYDK